MDINMVLDPDLRYTYTGFEIKPIPNINIDNILDLVPDIDFNITYKNNIDVGTATATIKSIRSKCCCDIPPWEKEFTFNIEKADLKDVNITCSKIDKDGVYNLGYLELYLGEYKLKYAHDFLYEIENVESEFEIVANITFIAKGDNFTGTQSVSFRVKKLYVEIKREDFTVYFRPSENDEWSEDCELYYNRLDQKPKVESRFIKDKDYTIIIPESVKAKTYNIIIRGIGNYTGEIIIDYKISKRDISDCIVDLGEISDTGGYDPDKFKFSVNRCYTPYPGEGNTYQLIKYDEYVLWYSTIKRDDGNLDAHIKVIGKNNYCGVKEFDCVIGHATIFVGRIVKLDDAILFCRYYGDEQYGKISGTYCLFDDRVFNNRIKITTEMEYCGIVGLITGWVDIEELDAEKTEDDKNKEHIYFLAGDEVVLYKNNIYDHFTDNKPSKVVTGKYYISKEALFNKRIRICRYKEHVGIEKLITGWIDISDLLLEEDDKK